MFVRMEGCRQMNDYIVVEVTEEAVQFIREKGAKEVTVMLAKSGGC